MGRVLCPAMQSFDPAAWPRLLNLGCGWDKRPDHLNIDLHAFHEPDLVADVRDLSMLPDAYYDGAVAQDVLEHLKRVDGPVALREWARVIRVGGYLELRVPNLLGLAVLLSKRTSIEQQRQLIQCLFGTQAYTGDYHLNGYTEWLLRHELRAAGFGHATVRPRDEWLFDVTAIRTPDDSPPDPEPNRFMHLHLPSAGPPSRQRKRPADGAAPPRAPRPPAPSARQEFVEWARAGAALGRRAARRARRDVARVLDRSRSGS